MKRCSGWGLVCVGRFHLGKFSPKELSADLPKSRLFPLNPFQDCIGIHNDPFLVQMAPFGSGLLKSCLHAQHAAPTSFQPSWL